MKRSAALAALSRDHHALEGARRLRRAGADDLRAAIEHFQAFWEPRGRAHFEIEEQLILPALPASDAEWHAATTRVRDEQAQIRAAAGEMRARAGVDAVETAHALGRLLHDHVRFEERHLFALLEARLPEADLARLGDAVERAHS